MGLFGVWHVGQFVRERPRILVAAPLEIDSEGRVQFKQRLRITHSIVLIAIYTQCSIQGKLFQQHGRSDISKRLAQR